jgi:hypothetical protein
MMGTLTYCPTNKNLCGMVMVFYAKHKRCFHADGFLLEKCLRGCNDSRSAPYKSTLISIKIP